MEAKLELPLPPTTVCAIIDACGKAGVQVLKLGPLYLRLGPKAENPNSHYDSLTPKEFAAVFEATRRGEGVPDHAQQNSDTLKMDEDELRAEQLRMLMIENPMEYERQLRDGELTDEPGESDVGE